MRYPRIAPSQPPSGACQELGHAGKQVPSARAHCCPGTPMLQQPLLAPWSAVCGQVSPQLVVIYYFQGRPLPSRFSSSVQVTLEPATFTHLAMEINQRFSRQASFYSGDSGP
eukprot:1685270-Pyramimonas_sp.AAC.1